MFTRSGLQVRPTGRGRGRGRGNAVRMNRTTKEIQERNEMKASNVERDTEIGDKDNEGQVNEDSKKKSELPIIKDTMEEWNNIEALKYIRDLIKKTVSVTTRDKEKEEGKFSIMKCNNRIKQLMKEKYVKKKANEESSANDGSKKNNKDRIIQLNRMKKGYELEKKQMEGVESDEKEQIRNMIEVVDDQIDDLMEQEKQLNRNKEEAIDKELLDEASEVAMNGGTEWDDLSYVNNMMIKVKVEKLKTNEEGKKSSIHKIAEMYRIRKNMLISQIVAYQNQLEEEGRITFEKGTGKLIVLDKSLMDGNSEYEEQEDEIMEEMEEDARDINMQEQYKHSENTEMVDLTADEEMSENNEVEATETTTITQETQNDTQTYLEPSKNKKKKLTHNNNETTEDTTYSNVLTRGKSNTEDEVKREKNEIRIHLQFKAEGVQGANLGQQIRPTLYDVMACTKTIDAKATLLGWEDNYEIKPLAGQEVKLIGETAILDYVKIPKKIKSLQNKKMYYQFGLRIGTTIHVDKFIDKWNKQKYNMREEISGLQWMVVRRSEMQTSSNAYPIGYFLGSIERGEYTTLRNEIEEITGTNTEMSFQIVHQKDITNMIWEEAKKIASNEYQNPNSRGNKRIKYANSPQAMVVYVDEINKMEDARMALYSEYGKTEGDNWRMLRDGSKMKFIPMFKNEIQSEKVFQKMKEALKLQATTKAGDVMIPLPLKDLFTPKEYLDGRSMEHMIHNAMSNDDTEIKLPLFKHITRRWMPHPNETEYEVAIQCKMLDKASSFLKTLKNNLTEAFGQEVKHHFIGNNRNNERQATNEGGESRKKNHDPSIDRVMEGLIIQDDTPDTFGKIYLEGMEKIEEEKKVIENPQAMLIIEAESQTSQSGVSEISRSSGISNITKQTQKNQKVTWSQELEEGVTSEEMIKKNKEKVKITLKEYQITEEEINEWTRTNIKDNTKQSYTMNEAIESIPYVQWKPMVRDIRKKRKSREGPEEAQREVTETMEVDNSSSKDEYTDKEFVAALETTSSEELMGYKNTNNKERTSHPTTSRELSHTSKTAQSRQSGESGGQ